MYNFKELLISAKRLKASDIHLISKSSPFFRVNGELIRIYDEKLNENEIKEIVSHILENDIIKYNEKGDIDIAYNIDGVGRFRINIYKEKGNDAIAIRIIENEVPNLNELHFPKIINEFSFKKKGLILITGPAGSGKSTTLASMINEINEKKCCHVITLEDPIEYIHNHKKSIISQREIGKDTKGYEEALESILREDPDVILIGEIRNYNTMKIAITAAETGHLVLSTLHTLSAAKTIDRIINLFPKEQQNEIKIELASILQGIICQQLLKSKDGKSRKVAFEIMKVIPSIESLIREGKTYQIPSIIQMGKKYGMVTMDMSIAMLYNNGFISEEEAFSHCENCDVLKKMIMSII